MARIAAVGTGLGDAETGHRRDRAGGGPRLHRPACARPVDPGRPHAGLRRGDNDAGPGSGGAAGRVLVPAPGGAGSGPELRRLHQLGLRPHRRHDRLQRGVLAGGVRPRHAGPSLGGERGQRDRGDGDPRSPGARAERGRHRHRHPECLRPRRRRAGTDRGVPARGRACRADLHPHRLHVAHRPGKRRRGLYPPDRLRRCDRRAHAHLPLQQLQQDGRRALC